jgi:hypothetical protein
VAQPSRYSRQRQAATWTALGAAGVHKVRLRQCKNSGAERWGRASRLNKISHFAVERADEH